jgi:hypothetical protein
MCHRPRVNPSAGEVATAFARHYRRWDAEMGDVRTRGIMTDKDVE